MRWCRVIEAQGLEFLVVVAEEEAGWGVVTSWMENGAVSNAILPATEFAGREDCVRFMEGLVREDVLALRRSVIEASSQLAEHHAEKEAAALMSRLTAGGRAH